MKKYLIIPILFLLASPLWAANIPFQFCVDPLGNDNNSGSYTDNSCWSTVAKVNAFYRQNRIKESEDHSLWHTFSRASFIADNAIAPDGTLTADKFVEDNTASNSHLVYENETASGSTSTGSVYAKAGERTQLAVRVGFSTNIFDLSSGTWVSGDGGVATITSIGNGWYRLSVTEDPAASTSFILYLASGGSTSYSGDGTSGVYIWGEQNEIGATATPYIPTSGSAVTASFQPGDTISFKRGQTWAETLTVPSSGTSGSHITYGAYSTGTYPSISGFDANGQTYVDYGAETITFTDITGATFATVYTSNSVMYEGIDNQVEVSISGTGCTYSKNGAAYTASADNVIVNDNVTVRKTSSGAASSGVSCVLTMGAASDTYTVTTRYGIPGRFPESPTEPSFPTWR